MCFKKKPFLCLYNKRYEIIFVLNLSFCWFLFHQKMSAKERMQAYRARLKANKAQHDKVKEKDRKRKKESYTSMSSMSDRQHRKTKKQWKASKRTWRQSKQQSGQDSSLFLYLYHTKLYNGFAHVL